MSLPRTIATRLLVSAAAVMALALATAAAIGFRGRLADASAELQRGRPLLLVLAGLVFASGIALHGLAWWAGLRARGCRPAPTDVAARYAVGSLANSVLPLRAGSALRLTLLAQVARDVRLTAAVAAAHGCVASLGVALVVAGAATIEPIPVWPAALLAGGGLLGAVVSLAVVRAPVRCAGLAGCVATALAARIGGVALVCAAYGIARPVVAAVAVVAAIEVAGLLPVTPGNLGLSTAAAAFALVTYGAPHGLAIAVGVALPVVETGTSIVAGLIGVGVLWRSAAIVDWSVPRLAWPPRRVPAGET